MLRILIADDHPVVRRGLVASLSQRPDWEVCGQANDGREVLDLALRLQPDVVVMDLVMPLLNGREALRCLHVLLPETESLVYSFRGSEQLVFDALSAGARGYVLKADPPDVLDAGVDSVSRHEPFVTATLLTPRLADFLQGRAPHAFHPTLLSPREREVLRLLSRGLRTSDMARSLGIAPKTVETYRSALMRKLRARSAAELISFALRNELDPV
jgi:two-component system response regulator NreC